MDLRKKAELHTQVKELTPFGNAEDFELSQRIGKLIQFSSMIEQVGSPQERIADAVVLQDLSRTTGISIFTLARETYRVHGKIGFSGNFYRGVINGSGEFLHRLRFKFNDARTSCIAYTKDKYDGELLESPPYTIEQAKAEGLYDKKGSKWLIRPDTMLINRVTYMFASMYASHLFIGTGKAFSTEQEFAATGGSGIDIIDAELE